MKVKHILSVVLAVFLILSVTSPVLGASINADASVAVVAGIEEEKMFCTATVEDDFEDDKVIVVLNNIASLECKKYGTSDFAEISCADVEDLSSATVARIQTRIAGLAETSIRGVSAAAVTGDDIYDIAMDKYHQILCLTLNETGKDKVLEAVKALEVRPDVLCAEPSYKVSLEAVPSDPYYSSQQWGLQKINLPSAWNYITGSSTFCVGILDAGIDKSHSDLGSNVDLSYSRDCTNDPITTVSSVTDPNGHGTLAAGVIGAIDSNNQGISGICWNAKLVSLKVLGGSEILYTQSILRAIQYAASTLTDGISGNNIRILNISLGDYYPDTTWDTVLCAINNYPGLIVCSAGNDDSNNDENSHYPSQLTMWADNVISVGASTESDEIVTDTNYGATSVDIFAPGEDILSCFPKTLCSSTNCTVNGHFAYGYHKFSGTSLAAPHVTGVAALMLAENPNLTPAEIKATIIETAKYKAAFDGKCVSNGRLDAYEAIKAVHIHRYNYTTTASTHTGTCRCGYTMGTQNHVLITDAYGTQVCKVCGYSRIGQID